MNQVLVCKAKIIYEKVRVGKLEANPIPRITYVAVRSSSCIFLVANFLFPPPPSPGAIIQFLYKQAGRKLGYCLPAATPGPQSFRALLYTHMKPFKSDEAIFRVLLSS
jgi:hypothetical protein